MTAFRAMIAPIAALIVVAAQPCFGAEELISDTGLKSANAGGQWWATPNIYLSARPGIICGKIPGGTKNPWDAIIGTDGLKLSKGTPYRFTIAVSASPSGPMRAYVQKGAEPWTAEGEIVRTLVKGEGRYSVDFTANENHVAGQVVFQLGGSGESWNFCIREVSLVADAKDGTKAASAPVGPSPAEGVTTSGALKINQTGYLPDGPKRANLVSTDKRPLEWQLLSAGGAILTSGLTQPDGFDKSSGLPVHRIDFSGFGQPGDGYRLKAGGGVSYPFSIGSDIYAPLRVDALSYFYPVRSGVEIKSTIAGKGYGRPAGHLGQSPNTGDTSVACLDKATSRRIYRQSWSCEYRLNVAGGWYDAGDFGKYVVNGGIAVAQMMGTLERAMNYGPSGSPARSDGLLRIPEARNRMPDILDEARWELDFLVAMMVPEGQPYAGMVHHKVHGKRWTIGPILPHLDPEQRALQRPSTAATLNLVAAAAQGARLFAGYDKAYAERLLAIARFAYAAAEANPAVLAPSTDGSFGGGDYEDDDVSDEFYWAAAEMFLTTGEGQWYERLKASRHWSAEVFVPEGFNWRSVAGLARLQLASVPSRLPASDLARIRRSVISAADAYMATQAREAFGFMYAPKNGFGWGSNQSLIQNMIVTAVAYDLSKDRRYLAGVRESMDYILGRNALGISYVTGHGTVYAQRQHSNMFANATDPAYPPPPKGALAGGPNSRPADDVARKALRNCAPQACYLDDPRSYSTNEIAINWNAPLGWIASFLADTR